MGRYRAEKYAKSAPREKTKTNDVVQGFEPLEQRGDDEGAGGDSEHVGHVHVCPVKGGKLGENAVKSKHGITSEAELKQSTEARWN